ncbi:hypothetical protein Bca4012_065001 [Brassica carinata]
MKQSWIIQPVLTLSHAKLFYIYIVNLIFGFHFAVEFNMQTYLNPLTDPLSHRERRKVCICF